MNEDKYIEWAVNEANPEYDPLYPYERCEEGDDLELAEYLKGEEK